MNSDQAEELISVPRRTLAGYIREIQLTGYYPLSEMTLVVDEIARLATIAEEHPSKAPVIKELVTWWRAFQKNLSPSCIDVAPAVNSPGQRICFERSLV